MRHHPARLNQKKRDGGELSADEIADFVQGVVDGSVGDAQLCAFLMAVCCRGMSVDEVRRALGEPDSEIVFAGKSKWTYRDLVVVFEGGRVTDVQF